MHKLGFTKTSRVWSHPRFAATLDFVSGPPAVGNLTLDNFMTLKTTFGAVTVTTPTQCLMDRLAGFYHWNDRQSLAQAILIATTCKVDLKAVVIWSKTEGMSEKCTAFRQALASTRRTGRRGMPFPR